MCCEKYESLIDERSYIWRDWNSTSLQISHSYLENQTGDTYRDI